MTYELSMEKFLNFIKNSLYNIKKTKYIDFWYIQVCRFCSRLIPTPQRKLKVIYRKQNEILTFKAINYIGRVSNELFYLLLNSH